MGRVHKLKTKTKIKMMTKLGFVMTRFSLVSEESTFY